MGRGQVVGRLAGVSVGEGGRPRIWPSGRLHGPNLGHAASLDLQLLFSRCRSVLRIGEAETPPTVRLQPP